MGSQGLQFHVRNIAIIGAGPSSLVAAKYLIAQGAFEKITLFEQQAEVGGIWNFSEEASDIRPVPQTDPFFPPDPPIKHGERGPAIFPSPLYDRLFANIQGSLMKLQGQDFPPESLVFPSRKSIQKYLLEYAKDLRHLIKFGYQVTQVSPQSSAGEDKWLVEARSASTGEVTREVFDAVVVGNGHYSVPYMPDMKNIREFDKRHPGNITHSKHYRDASHYAEKKVVVVGNGPSGTDIVTQVAVISKYQPLLSVRHATSPDKLANTGAEEVAEIEEFLVEDRGLRFKDGRVEKDIDAIIFCTGFFYSYPFFPHLQHELISSGRAVHDLYQHLFHLKHPTLVFPSLNMKAVPWPVAEAQAAVFSAVWSNELPLPSASKMEEWYRALYDERGESMHVFKPLEDAHYINEMHDWVMKASHIGKQPPRWGDEKFWERTIYTEARIRFEQQGFEAKSLKELGFEYKPEEDGIRRVLQEQRQTGRP